MSVDAQEQFIGLLRQGGHGPVVRRLRLSLLRRNTRLLLPSLIAELEAAAGRSPQVAEELLADWLTGKPNQTDLLFLVSLLPEGRATSHQQRVELWRRLTKECSRRGRTPPLHPQFLRLCLADAFLKDGRLGDAEATATDAIQNVLQAKGNGIAKRRHQAFGFSTLAGVYLAQGRLPEAMDASRTAARLLPASSRTSESLAFNQVVLNSVANTLLEAGDTATALVLLERASSESLDPSLRTGPGPDMALKYQLRLANAWLQFGDFRRARLLASRAWTTARKAFGREPERTMVPFLLAADILSQVQQETGRADRAYTVRTEALIRLRSFVAITGHRHLRAYIEELLGYSEFCLNIAQPDSAWDAAQSAVESLPLLEKSEKRRDPMLRGAAWTVLAECASARGDFPTARSAAAKAVRNLSTSKDERRTDFILYQRAKAAGRTGPIESTRTGKADKHDERRQPRSSD